MGVLGTSVTLLTGLRNLGCELHKNAFGGRVRGGSYSAAKTPDLLAVITGQEGGQGKESVLGEEGELSLIHISEPTRPY